MVLELLKSTPGVLDLIHGPVESESVVMFAARFVIGEHAVAILHGEDLIIHATIVTVLVPQIVQLLPQFSNKLVLLA